MPSLNRAPGYEASGDQEGNGKHTHTTPTTDTEEQPTRDEEVGKLDLLPRRHVGRRRPQNRVELRLGRGQVIQVRVPKRF